MRTLTALALLLALTPPASAACYWSRQGEFCEPDAAAPSAQHGQTNYGFAGGYRTLCVRTCDGYYFPISYATDRSRFKIDEAACQSMYPPGEAALYVHRATGQDATLAVSLTGAPLARESFAFSYRSNYDRACAALFRSGSGALISVTKPPEPESVVAASMVTPVALLRRGKPPKLPNAAAAAAMAAANPNPDEQYAENRGEAPIDAEGVRVVGPAYRPLASTEGELPKFARPEVPAPPVMSTDEPPVAASILRNPLDFFRNHQSGPPPEPDAEPAD